MATNSMEKNSFFLIEEFFDKEFIWDVLLLSLLPMILKLSKPFLTYFYYFITYLSIRKLSNSSYYKLQISSLKPCVENTYFRTKNN